MPHYKSIADSEDFGLMIVVRFNQYVAVTANMLTGTDEIIKISAVPQGICGGRYISSLKIMCVVFTR